MEDAREMPQELADALYALPPDVTKLPPELEQAMRGMQGAILINCPGGSLTGKPAAPVGATEAAPDAAAAPAVSTALDAATQMAEATPDAAATPPAKAAGPKLLRNLILSIIAGTLLAAGAALTLELFDRRVRSSADLLDLPGGTAVPVLAEIRGLPMSRPTHPRRIENKPTAVSTLQHAT